MLDENDGKAMHEMVAEGDLLGDVGGTVLGGDDVDEGTGGGGDGSLGGEDERDDGKVVLEVEGTLAGLFDEELRQDDLVSGELAELARRGDLGMDTFFAGVFPPEGGAALR